MRKYQSFRDFDWTLLGFVMAISLIGVIQIYSASISTRFGGVHVKQMYWLAAGLVLMFLVSLVGLTGS